MTIFNTPPFLNSQNTGQLAALDRYAKYVVDRYGAYVDFWELMNETTANAGFEAQLAADLRARDPYHHEISTSFPDAGNAAIDIDSPHWYGTENELSSDLAAHQHISAERSHGKLIIFGEQGNSGQNWDARSGVRLRLRLWSSFFNEGTLLFWNSSFAKDYRANAANVYMGPEERGYGQVFGSFVASVDADTAMVSSTASSGLRPWALASSTQAWVYVTDTVSHTTPRAGGTVSLTSPVAGTATFLSPADGTTLGTASVNAGATTLNLPTFTTDIAVHIQ
jgi:hypothetical protein